MNFEAVDPIAKALLYEGYLLYPYRTSSVKNQWRWTFGCLFPPGEASFEGSNVQVECLLRGDSQTEVEVQARFLQLRGAGEIVERQHNSSRLKLLELIQKEHCGFAFPPIRGGIDVSAQPVGDNLFKLCVQLRNLTPSANGKHLTRDEGLPLAMISTHMMVGTRGGNFLSMQDPPEMVHGLAESCRQIRVWPVLIGDPDRCDTMLATPIILSDFPQIAAQSHGDLFDSTEMDEMLTLRIQTLTPDEKREISALDSRAELLLRRTEALTQEQMEELHGKWEPTEQVRSPITRTWVNDWEITTGMHVRLRPRGKADAFDLALDGMTAEVISIEQDFEDRIYLSVVIDDDPGRDFGVAGKPGHRFYFQPEEVEPIEGKIEKVKSAERDTGRAMKRILIAGIGNIFFGDDAFGVELVRRLDPRCLPTGVTTKEFGIRGFDLACALQEDYDAVILVDAIQRGGTPGTLHLIEPDTEPIPATTTMEMHHLDPVQVIQMAQRMGPRLPLLRLVGCEPALLEPAEDGKMSDPVEEAVPRAILLVKRLVMELLGEKGEVIQ